MKPKILILGNESDVRFVSPTSTPDPDFNVPAELQSEFTVLIGTYDDEPKKLLYSQLSDFAMPDWAIENAHIINAFDHMVLKHGVDFARKYSFSYGSGTNSYDVGLCINDGFCHWRKFDYLLSGGSLTPTEEMLKNIFSLNAEQKEIFYQLVALYKKAEECGLQMFFDRIEGKLNGFSTTHMDEWFFEDDKRFYDNPLPLSKFMESAPCSDLAGYTIELEGRKLYATLK